MLEELFKVSPAKETVLTIGVFDGVHLGHQRLILQTKDAAAKSNALSVVLTFSNHPLAVLSPGTVVTYLNDLEERLELLKALGVDYVIAVSFTEETAQLSARQFVSLLRQSLKMRGLVVGPDFALGHNREGNVPTLRALGQEMGFSVDTVEPITQGDQIVSSTSIRRALAQGDVARAGKLLGRPFTLRGRVVKGEKRGKSLGFPTANIDVSADQALPADGVYVTRAYVADFVYPSATNIGIRPTFPESRRTVEVYIIDFDGDLYGKRLKIELVERLRGEIRFESVEELKEQMIKDIERTRALLS